MFLFPRYATRRGYWVQGSRTDVPCLVLVASRDKACGRRVPLGDFDGLPSASRSAIVTRDGVRATRRVACGARVP